MSKNHLESVPKHFVGSPFSARGVLVRPDDRPIYEGANLVFLMSRIAAARNDDTAAADALERGMQMKSKLGLSLQGRGDDDVWAEIHFRRAKAALARGDAAATTSEVKSLVQFAPSNSDSALSMMDWLKQNGRDIEAKKMFDRVYAQARSRVDQSAQAALAQRRSQQHAAQERQGTFHGLDLGQ